MVRTGRLDKQFFKLPELAGEFQLALPERIFQSEQVLLGFQPTRIPCQLSIAA
jgi:hypothetical protein